MIYSKAGKIREAALRGIKALGLSALLAAAFCSSASAAIPVKFTYQGNLRQAGFLVSGARNMVFRVYSSSTAPAALWTSATFSVQLSTGVFKVNLEPVISDWESGSLWLELEVEGVRLSPREELTSSPYAVNALLVGGKKYSSASAAPASPTSGDLWFDTSVNELKYYNGTAWVLTSGGVPAAHAALHAAGGSDPIVNLGTYSITGNIVFNSGAGIKAAAGVPYVYISTSVSVAGTISGDGSGLFNLNASNVSSGFLSGDRIAAGVLVSTHVAARSLDRLLFANSGCADSQLLKWNNGTSQWVCSNDNFAGGSEADPISIHNQNTLQAGTTFYVSSGTVNYLTVNNQLDVFGTARIHGAPAVEGLSVNASGNVGVGLASASAKLEVKGSDTQNYNLAVGTSTTYSMVVSTGGALGVGTTAPKAKMEITGEEVSGRYIMIMNSGSRVAAWLRNK